MTENTSTERDTIEQLADSFVARFRAGQRPSIDEYTERYPELADELRELLPALVLLEQNASVDDTVALGGARKHPAAPPREIGDFSIVREIGRGGMGVVYEAVQQSLGRHVALKVLSSPGLLNPTHLERFHLEARAAARLHHTHIVPVFGVGEHDGLHYYAMQFIQGHNLDMVIDELRRLRRLNAGEPPVGDAGSMLTRSVAEGMLTGQFRLGTGGVVNATSDDAVAERFVAGVEGAGRNGYGKEPAEADPATTGSAAESTGSASTLSHSEFTTSHGGREFYHSVARVGLQVAEALAYAHAEGVLHRDIKPSNLLLDARGNVWVTDFGLARDESSDGLTRTGDFVGTLRYMAPERLEGWSDRRSDIYGLGATLYELLTLRPFLNSPGRGQLVDKILHENPATPSKFDPAIPRDLETIVLKSIAKEPATRYRTADEMAEDLRRFLADRPILARRSTPTERFVRWCRRNPMVAGLSAAVAALLLAAVVILSISNARVRREASATEAALQEKLIAIGEKDEALTEKETALKDREAALATAREKETIERGRFYAAQMNLASQAWRDGQHARTVQLLETLRPRRDERDLRGFEWYHLYHESHANVTNCWRAHWSIIHDMAWSPDGKFIVSASNDGSIRLWDGETGEQLGCIATGPQGIWDIDFSGDGKILAVAFGNGEVVVLDFPTRREMHHWMAHPVSDGVRAIAVSPDGALIATGSWMGPSNPVGVVSVWNTDGELIQTFEGSHKGGVGAVEFSPNGELLAAAAFDFESAKSLIVWSVADNFEEKFEVHGVGAQDIEFSEDGKTIWMSDLSTIQEVDVVAGTLRRSLAGHTAGTPQICRIPGKKLFVTASADRTMRLWNSETAESRVFGAEMAQINAAAVDPTGKRIACGDNNGWITLRDLADPLPTPGLEENLHPDGGDHIDSLAFTPDGESLYVGFWPLNIVEPRTLALKSIGPQGAIVAISPRCDFVAAYDRQEKLEIWNTETRSTVCSMNLGKFDRAVFSWDGTKLATWKRWSNNRLTIWDAKTGGQTDQLTASSISVLAAAFSPTKPQVAFSSQFIEFSIYDMEKKAIIDVNRYAPVLVSVVELAYSPDGSLIAAGLSNGQVMLFDVDSASGGAELRTILEGHSLVITGMRFSADGLTLATACADTTVRLWDVALGQERTTYNMDARLFELSPDGRRMAVVSGNRQLRILTGSDLPSAKAVHTWRDDGDLESPPELRVRARTAWDHGDLETAEQLLRREIAFLDSEENTIHDGTPASFHISGYCRLARLLKIQGRADEADTLLKRSHELAERYLAEYPDHEEAYRFRGSIFGENRRWQEASADWERAVELQPFSVTNHADGAILKLLTGGVPQYRRACEKMFSQFRDAKEEDQQTGLAWTCCLAPDALADLSVPLKNARYWATAEPDEPTYFTTLGGLLYRAGDYAGAVAPLRSAIAGFPTRPSDPATNLLPGVFLAMAEWNLGHADESRRLLQEAHPAIESAYLSSAPWLQRAMLEVLHNEAKSLIKPAPAAGAGP